MIFIYKNDKEIEMIYILNLKVILIYEYLVNINIPFLEFCNILRSSIKLNKEEGLTYIIGDSFCIQSFHLTIGELYHSHKSNDLFFNNYYKKKYIWLKK